jgi:hypothetical protein
MRKLALSVAVLILLASRSKPAAAHCGQDCPPLFEAIGWTLAAGIVGGYGYGTGYMIYRDATGAEQTLGYGGTELAINAALATLFVGGTASEIREGHPGWATVIGALALTHTALAVHGAKDVYLHRSEIRVDPQTLQAAAGLAIAANATIWALQAPGPHGRQYGLAEAAVNAPLAAGLGYLAVDRAHAHDTKHMLLYGGMAAVSGALAIHGARYAIAPTRKPALDLDLDFDLGHGVDGELAPTIVSDGKQVAPGVGASGTW